MGVLMVIVLAFAVAQTASSQKLRVGVLEFEEKNELEVDNAGVVIPEILVSELKRIDAYELNERVYLRQTLEEQKLQMTGAIDEETAAEAGKILGLEGIVVGSAMRVGNTTTISGRLVEVETGRIVESGTVEYGPANRLEDAVEELAYYLAGYTEKEYRERTTREALARVKFGVTLGAGYSFNHKGDSEISPLALGLFFDSLYAGADVFGFVPVGDVTHFAARVYGYPTARIGVLFGYLYTFDDMQNRLEGKTGDEFFQGEYHALLAGLRIRANEVLSGSLAFGPTMSGIIEYQSKDNIYSKYDIDTFFEFPPAAIAAEVTFGFTEDLSGSLRYVSNGGEGTIKSTKADPDAEKRRYHDVGTVAVTGSYSFSF
jgi:hypothetical protein